MAGSSTGPISRGGVYGGSAEGSTAMPQGDVVPRAGARGQALPGADVAGQCPVVGKVSFVDTWAAARARGRTHQGTDMFAAVGTPVVALAAASVTRVDPVDTSGPGGAGDLGGITVSYTTDHGDRWYNAHLSALRPGIREGERLAAGTVIGFVGRSGDARTTPAHLHIEFHPAGGAAQPNYDILRAACS